MNTQAERPFSPYIARCSTTLGDEVCCGCGRTFAEVARWVVMSEVEREFVWQRLETEGFWPQDGGNGS